MGIIGGLFWILIGIVYIIYRCAKDDAKLTFAAIGTFIVYLLPMIACTPLLIALSKTNDQDEAILYTILIGLIIIGGYYLIYRWAKSKPSPEKAERTTSRDCDKIRKAFDEVGIKNVDEKYIRQIAEHPRSPANNKISVTPQQCYHWVSHKRYHDLYQHTSEEELGKELGVPISDIPLNYKLKRSNAEYQRQRMAIKYIMDREGLDFYTFCAGDCMREYDEGDYPKQFEEFVDNYKKYGKPKSEEERKMREKELDILYQVNFDSFCELLGYKLPKYEYPFSNSRFQKHRKMVAKWEILFKEGYAPQTDIDIKLYGDWKNCKLFMDRSYELYTMKHSEFELIYGAKLTDDLLKSRSKLIDIILLREGIKKDGFICGYPLTPAYEKEGAAEAAFELLKN